MPGEGGGDAFQQNVINTLIAINHLSIETDARNAPILPYRLIIAYISHAGLFARRAMIYAANKVSSTFLTFQYNESISANGATEAIILY